MAEFREVVKQYIRMCRSSTCEKCVLSCMNAPPCWARAKQNPEKFERLVMDWAKEHSKPVYPTWAEWARDMNIHGMDTIPADIAERLGIEPKGGIR